MAQTAHDFAYFEGRAADPKPKVRAVKGKKKPSRFQAGTAKIVAGTVVMVVLLCSFINSKVALNEISANIQNTQKQLVNAQSEYNYLSSVLDGKTGLKNEEIAIGQLGLMKIDKSQITYFSLENESQIQRPESASKRVADFFSTGMLSLMDYLNP